ncbi:IclR family transcriptional regulator [Jiella sp. MQZ9-1]|uniref:IclR family transcriptional regulator n=1 Tax=Jiella flava TaxID=2816857 RepID=A0A939JQK7_9HYPH|nr:IclR family transcriptional regulator [Jiella flava]MBO0660978.1 IclR family transcriptional regulator [Jiella flava]MCD2469626.1 IclR family transcriptional regulator [Jiella flava]
MVKSMRKPDDDANGNPTIDRMMMILRELERAPEGLRLGALVQRTRLARSTVYRLLNALEAHGMLRQLPLGAYVLGARLLELADKVTATSRLFPLVPFVQPLLDGLANRVGETCKIAVVERGAIMPIAGAMAKTPHALSYTVGEYLPAHAGAASKMLMAHCPADERDAMLAGTLDALTPLTLTDRSSLEREYAAIRNQGWSHDPGEYSLSVRAFAAPIQAPDTTLLGALSITFMAGSDAAFEARIRESAITGAAEISQAIAERRLA